MKDWKKNILFKLKTLLVYIKDILMAGMATSIVVGAGSFAIITSYSETVMKTQDWIAIYGIIYIISVLILAIITPFDEWEENDNEKGE